MKDFMATFHSNYSDITRMTLFNYLKTGNPVYDTIISTIIISLFGYFVNYIYDYQVDRILYKLSIDDIKSWFFRKNTIVIEGKRSSITSSYGMSYSVTSVYSDRFKAVLNYIILNIDTNNTIYKIKEVHSNFQSSENNESKRKNMDIFMVYQNKHFKLDDNIFVKAEIEQEDDRDDKEKIKSKTDKIIISIYSYIYSVSYLKKYIDNITEKYLLSIKDNRLNQKFIYFLDKVKLTDDESRMECWREDTFESARTFNNIFFDGKLELISQINFFLNNREWYYEKGIPYSIGIGLHGPPGTGKTSFIKALANYTNRHIIVFSLKLIKTKSQLEQFFFENTYNDKNEYNSIGFDKKIIVFEDIDCIGDIILERNRNKAKDNIKSKKNKSNKNKDETDDNNNKNNNSITDVLQTICELNESGSTKITNINQDELITLDDILNLWDGIRETPGRILVISSNHYDKLDSALIRPGRIDITHELKNASHDVISQIYLHLFKQEINKSKLKKIKENFYSPAELINIYVKYKNNENKFMERLLENKKISN